MYKGRKKKTIIYYAIKSVEKSQKPRVLQEVRTMHALDHNNLLKFYAWYETTNHLWLILEYCSGGDLMSLLKQVRKTEKHLSPLLLLSSPLLPLSLSSPPSLLSSLLQTPTL